MQLTCGSSKPNICYNSPLLLDFTCKFEISHLSLNMQILLRHLLISLMPKFQILLPPKASESQCTLVCRINVHARLSILRKKSPLHGLTWVCTFIDFEKKFPPARLFHPARLLVLVQYELGKLLS